MRTLLLAATVSVVACTSTVSVQPATTSTDVGTVSVERAARDIASTRCSRELSCGNIGPGDVKGCVQTVQGAARESVMARCSAGVAPAYLSSCLEDVRNETCGTAGTMAERLATTCREAKLCL